MFTNKSGTLPGSAGILPAPSGILPDGLGTLFRPRIYPFRKLSGRMPDRAGKMPALPCGTRNTNHRNQAALFAETL